MTLEEAFKDLTIYRCGNPRNGFNSKGRRLLKIVDRRIGRAAFKDLQRVYVVGNNAFSGQRAKILSTSVRGPMWKVQIEGGKETAFVHRSEIRFTL